MDLSEVADDLGSQAVEFIERSNWPVRTGFSLRHFGHRVVSPTRVQIVNEADYAILVEERTGIINRTLSGADWDTAHFESAVAVTLGGAP